VVKRYISLSSHSLGKKEEERKAKTWAALGKGRNRKKEERKGADQIPGPHEALTTSRIRQLHSVGREEAA